MSTPHSRLPVLERALLCGALLALGACCDSSSSGGSGSTPPPPDNLPPYFFGLKGVITAGGDRILLRWEEATDDYDDPATLRYRIYLSATSGGQDFESPVATTGPGETSIQLSSSDSALIAVGTEVFAVVRAMDSQDAEDPNTAECPLTCVDAASVAFVDSTKAGPGTLGDPSDPFLSIQDGIDAIPAAGGAVLIAGGTYAELPAATDAGDPGSVLAVFGSFPMASFAAGVTPQALLAAYTPDGDPSVIDGEGLDPSTVPDQVGHLDVRNGGRRTYVGGFAFQDDEDEYLVGAIDADLVVSDCRFTDPTLWESGIPFGVRIESSAPGAFEQRLQVAGCSFTGMLHCVSISGDVADLRLNGCRVEDSVAFVYDAYSTIPAAADFVCHLKSNDIARLENHPLYLNTYPEVDHGSGSVAIHVLDNRIAGVDASISLQGFGQHGTDGLEIRAERNHMGPILSNAFYINLLPNASVDDEYIAGETIDLVFRDNDFVHMNSEVLYLLDLTPGPGAELNFEVDDCLFLQGDHEVIEAKPSQPSSATFSQDGTTQTTVLTDLVVHGTDGFLLWDQRRYRAGAVTLRIEDCIALQQSDDFLEIDVEEFMTDVTSAPDPTDELTFILHGCETTIGDTGQSSVDLVFYPEEGPADIWVSVCNNRLYGGDQSHIRSLIQGARGYLVFAHNAIEATEPGRSMYIEFDGDDATWTALVARNQLVGGGEDGEEGLILKLRSPLAGADVLARNNLLTGTGSGLEVDSWMQSVQMINNTVAFCGEGVYDIPVGSDDGGLNAGVYVANCISHGNNGWDIPEETIAQYSCFAYPATSAGMGCWLGDPTFFGHGSILDVNTWFQLAYFSPCRDAGNPDVDFRDPDGSRNDMGAFGGPGAGRLGLVEDPEGTLPFLMVGVNPLLDLHAGTYMIDTGEDVTVVFNAEVDAATVSTSTLAFEVGGVAVAGTYAVDGREVTFSPTGGWTNSSQVHLVAATGLRSVDGQALDHRHARWFAITPAATAAEVEPNDSLATASPLGPDAVERLQGDLLNDADTDFISFSGAAGERVQVSLFAHRLDPASPANFGLRLYGPAGTVLYENSHGMPVDDPFIEWTLLETGTHTIEVFDEGSGAGAGPFNWEMEAWRR